MLTSILLLLLDTACGFVTLMLLARFLMQWARVSFRNPLGQFVVATTDWAVRPLRRVLPGLMGLDLASLVHGILYSRILEWVAFPFSRRSSQPKDQTQVSCTSCIGRRVLYHGITQKARGGREVAR